MNAIIVPGITDLNKGDQALVWESYRLIKATKLYKEIYVISSANATDQSIEQSLNYGLKMIDNIMLHPRREKHNQKEHIKESKLEFLRLVKNAVYDFFKSKYILHNCNNLKLIKKKFSYSEYKTIEKFKEADAIFIKGGGFIHAYGEIIAPYLMWYFLFYVRLAKKLKKKVFFLPNSFGPFSGFTVKKQVRSVLSGIDLIYAREHLSSGSLGKLLGKNIPVEMDLGFFLPKGNQESALAVLNKYNLDQNKKIVGVTIRPWRFPGKNNPDSLYESYLDSVNQFINYITELGYKVALCNQSLGPNAHEDDRNAIKDLLEINNNPDVVWINENLTCEVLKAVYSNFYFFIGTRFHSIIFSLTSAVPSIAIGYGGNKAEGIMSDFDLNNYVIPIDNVNHELLIEKFNQAILEYDIIKNKISRTINLIDVSRNRIINDIKALY